MTVHRIVPRARNPLIYALWTLAWKLQYHDQW